jgi:hypothetical protein
MPVSKLILTIAAFTVVDIALAQEIEDYEKAPINYSSAVPHDPAAAIQARLGKGELLPGETDREFVKTLLHELNIPIESQVLVFSKTSFQRHRINPHQPRALYFNDNAYVGWVPGGLVEVAAIDPVLGPIFYTVNPAAARTNRSSCFVRDSDCLRCHGGNFVRGIPGVFVRSVFSDEEGEPLLRHGSEVVDFRTAFMNRWGGWYVTGKHGTALHRGNIFAREENGRLAADFARGANVTNLSAFIDTRDYLTGTSDIVALLVLEHQTAMHNALTQASINCRKMMEYQKNLQKAFKEPITEEPTYDSVKSVFDSTARELTHALLFKDEAILPTGLEGNPDFQQAFLRKVPRTKNGESLKDFCLKGHLFKNRCSYLIYSDGFLNLPQALKKRVFAQLKQAFAPNDPDPRYPYLDDTERGRIVRILSETHREFGPELVKLAAQTSVSTQTEN